MAAAARAKKKSEKKPKFLAQVQRTSGSEEETQPVTL